MDNLKEIKLKIEKVINPVALFEKTVVKCSNGAITYIPKQYIGKKALIIILDEDKENYVEEV